MTKHENITYIEFPTKDIQATKKFFIDAFGFSFKEFGDEYIAFSGRGVDGGFFKSEMNATTSHGSALAVFYSNQLEETQAKIEKAGGSITKPTFTFPGGRRFHFSDPAGNEYAVWSDLD